VSSHAFNQRVRSVQLALLLSPPHETGRLGPEALRAALVDLHELWLSSRAATVGVGPGTALVALGGLARRELVPYTDLDLLLVHDAHGAGPDPPTVQGIAESLWYPLREAGIAEHHSAPTVGEAVQMAMTDLQVGVCLLDARAIGGDLELAERLLSAARRAWRASLPGRFDDVATTYWFGAAGWSVPT
jgi:[protein-PII] uridylyltransferase